MDNWIIRQPANKKQKVTHKKKGLTARQQALARWHRESLIDFRRDMEFQKLIDDNPGFEIEEEYVDEYCSLHYDSSYNYYLEADISNKKIYDVIFFYWAVMEKSNDYLSDAQIEGDYEFSEEFFECD